LTGKRSSLVWTENRAEAARITNLSEDEFHDELEKRFGLHLGEIRALDKPRAFPLGYFVARSFIAERLALVGDAAHVIHPIAGQGLNLDKPTCWSAISAGGGSTPWRWGLPPTR
jgi:2-octaprenyl-6-methoxyphenol hydroxylase